MLCVFQDRYTILKSDLITNIDNICISGIEPSSIILNQTNYGKRLSWIAMPK